MDLGHLMVEPKSPASRPSSVSKPEASQEQRALAWAHTARFLTTASQLDQLPATDLPEIAFVGRSNAGKSTAINRLAQQNRLAFASRTPGRTQHINLFEVGPKDSPNALLADLPGYGYAAVERSAKLRWQQVMADYLELRRSLTGIVPGEPGSGAGADNADFKNYPDFAERVRRRSGVLSQRVDFPVCRGPVKYRDLAPLNADLARLRGNPVVGEVAPPVDGERQPEAERNAGDEGVEPRPTSRMAVHRLVLERVVPGEQPGGGGQPKPDRQGRPAPGQGEPARIDGGGQRQGRDLDVTAVCLPPYCDAHEFLDAMGAMLRQCDDSNIPLHLLY